MSADSRPTAVRMWRLLGFVRTNGTFRHRASDTRSIAPLPRPYRGPRVASIACIADYLSRFLGIFGKPDLFSPGMALRFIRQADRIAHAPSTVQRHLSRGPPSARSRPSGNGRRASSFLRHSSSGDGHRLLVECLASSGLYGPCRRRSLVGLSRFPRAVSPATGIASWHGTCVLAPLREPYNNWNFVLPGALASLPPASCA